MTAGQEANVAVVERIAKSIEGKGPLGMLDIFEEVFHPDFEWHPNMIGFSRISYRGRNEFEAYLRQMETTTRRVELNDWSVRPVGASNVLLVGRLTFESRAQDHITVDSEYAVLYRMEDGQVRSGRSFASIEAAEEAAMELSDAQA